MIAAMYRLATLLALAFPLLAQLPPGTSRMQFPDRDAMTDASFFAATADGTLWAASILDDDLERIRPAEGTESFTLPWHGTRAMTAGPDGALWAGGGGWVARVDPATAAVRRWPIGTHAVAEHMLAGPDGNLWFLQGSSVVRMRPDGKLLSSYGAVRATSAAFGTDGALYLAATGKLVRLTAGGEQAAFPALLQDQLFAGPGFFWNAPPRTFQPRAQAVTEIVKLSYDGETLAAYRLPMTPFASDSLGNLWLRGTTEDGDVVGQLSPFGVLTRFGPLPALPTNDCFPPHYGGMAFLPDGRVAMSDYYLPILTLGHPCRLTPKPDTFRNTVTILDPRIAPVLSVQPLSPTRRRTVRR